MISIGKRGSTIHSNQRDQIAQRDKPSKHCGFEGCVLRKQDCIPGAGIHGVRFRQAD